MLFRSLCGTDLVADFLVVVIQHNADTGVRQLLGHVLCVLQRLFGHGQHLDQMCIRDRFMTDDLVGRGLPMFLPAGYTVWQELENYIKAKERARGYLHVMTPCIGTVNLYKTSGHWDHYLSLIHICFPAGERAIRVEPWNADI